VLKNKIKKGLVELEKGSIFAARNKDNKSTFGSSLSQLFSDRKNIKNI
jgi:hypothetical protein